MLGAKAVQQTYQIITLRGFHRENHVHQHRAGDRSLLIGIADQDQQRVGTHCIEQGTQQGQDDDSCCGTNFATAGTLASDAR